LSVSTTAYCEFAQLRVGSICERLDGECDLLGALRLNNTIRSKILLFLVEMCLEPSLVIGLARKE
jgi:hypothetical protein